ncbi:MAG TPA: hypothetical protein VHD36_07465 [Pirellulales bacterium]|nr:hypothetical protein [Pirellulales bacterium]
MPHTSNRLQLPGSLETQLYDYRRRVWIIKSIEAACGAIFGVLVSYLTIFGLDRLIDTPDGARITIFAVAVAACAFVPVYLHRWVWRQRQFVQLARLLSRRYPSLGDQLLGVIELVRNEFEQHRSRALCEAAVQQVAGDAARRNFHEAVPNPRHRLWAWAAATPLAAAVLLLVLFPSAALNAWSRFMAPWEPIPRYTFTALEELPETLVVAHGEPVTISVRLREDSRRRPATGTVQLGNQPPVEAELKDGAYEFSLPSQIAADTLYLRIGDARQTVHLEPMLRPELTSVTAAVTLPEYLGRPEKLEKDVRGGALTLVRGSTAQFAITASRDLASAALDAEALSPTGASLATAPVNVDESRQLSFEWRDKFGLAGREPFQIAITAQDDAQPSLACDTLPRQKVVLASETLSFKVRAMDDFGVKVVGIEWQGLDENAADKVAHGERALAAGGHDKEFLDIAATFCAESLEIEPQPLAVRLYAEDYLPGRERVYSPTFVFYVLSAEQHYIWLTEQLSKWHRQSLEVRDRELQLHHTNEQLRALAPEELDKLETRRQIESQAAAERNNGRRLTGLVNSGEDLVRQAMRNPEFGIVHLEKLGEMLQILKDISANRMPNVADLLKQSSQAQGALANAQGKSPPVAGNVHTTPTAKAGGDPPKPQTPQPMVPKVVDNESSQQPPSKDDDAGKPGKGQSPPKLKLPVTTVASTPPKKDDKDGEKKTPEEQKLDEAVVVQKDLLAEFEKIADELNKVLANLEGSTLVKRLKAASREQYVVAGKIGDHLGDTFGMRGRAVDAAGKNLLDLSEVELASSQKVSTIMDDMQAYFERRRMQRFKIVLDEMREQDAVGSLRQLGDDVRLETGMSIAQCEFWSDTLDRWADNLVDPACAGECACKGKGCLPPAMILEAMKILEAEVNLREETRVAQQAKAAIEAEKHMEECYKLSTTQDGLTERVRKLNAAIKELPDAEQDFALEIKILTAVEKVMNEATGILMNGETGNPAIAAETEAIELLLRSKRINPKGGGGGGSSPGGGGQGTTNDSALALVGNGMNDKEVREDRGVQQSTGDAGTSLPEEFRAGLDEYFNRLEREPGSD